jgi:hypothetical protein
MPGIAPPCAECQHPEAVHLQTVSGIGEGNGCRVTNCPCPGYGEPSEATEEPAGDAKRLVIEIPDGFAVTVQLMPVEPA